MWRIWKSLLVFLLKLLVIRISESNRLKEENKHESDSKYTLTHTYIDWDCDESFYKIIKVKEEECWLWKMGMGPNCSYLDWKRKKLKWFVPVLTIKRSVLLISFSNFWGGLENQLLFLSLSVSITSLFQSSTYVMSYKATLLVAALCFLVP